MIIYTDQFAYCFIAIFFYYFFLFIFSHKDPRHRATALVLPQFLGQAAHQRGLAAADGSVHVDRTDAIARHKLAFGPLFDLRGKI